MAAVGFLRAVGLGFEVAPSLSGDFMKRSFNASNSEIQQENVTRAKENKVVTAFFDEQRI